MDNLTHSLFGLTLAQTPLRRVGPGATLTLVLASNAPDSDIVREGEKGDSYLIIGSGRVEVSVVGHRVAELGPGEAFGEIALLRGVPRTATVRALDAATIYTIACTDFHEAISGPTSAAIARAYSASSSTTAARPLNITQASCVQSSS